MLLTAGMLSGCAIPPSGTSPPEALRADRVVTLRSGATLKVPVVVVFASYRGMPAPDMEKSVTSVLERALTRCDHLEHIESKSVLGIGIIKVAPVAGDPLEGVFIPLDATGLKRHRECRLRS